MGMLRLWWMLHYWCTEDRDEKGYGPRKCKSAKIRNETGACYGRRT